VEIWEALSSNAPFAFSFYTIKIIPFSKRGIIQAVKKMFSTACFLSELYFMPMI
jgi:hypothetical protein